jgi:hypothetical protein
MYCALIILQRIESREQRNGELAISGGARREKREQRFVKREKPDQ